MRDDLEWFGSQLHQRLDVYMTLSAAQVSALYEHYELLKRWNSKINLTSIRSPEEIVSRHYCESLFFAAHLPHSVAAAQIADVGSGAGFPGIPMAVLQPDWQVGLIESHQRKAVFLREGTRGLPNVKVISQRAEQVTESFDWIVSRAVAPDDVLALVPKLGPCVGLLIGASDLDATLAGRRVTWSEPIEIPWSEQQVCLFGTCI